MDDDQQFCLRWNNHQSTLVAVFDTLLENGTLVDCTLAAEGKCLNAHKVVLSACSPYFEALLSRHFDKHPILILKDVKFQELKAMMDYMYRGEVNISQDQLGALLKAAESLQIKGLSDNRKGETERKPAPIPPPPKSPQPTSALPKVQGLTIEQRSREDSREGSMSPGPRKKKRLRRKSEELDNHDASNSSESHSLPAQNIPSSLPAVSKINADVPEPVETKSEILRHKQPDDIPQVPIIKEKLETHTELMLEPKSEYVEEMNEDSIEDLTLDDDDLSNMEQMDDQAGPSHGNAGEGSSQGFGGWHMGNQSQDEVFLAAQEAVGAHRDSQGAIKVASDKHLLEPPSSKKAKLSDSSDKKDLPEGKQCQNALNSFIQQSEGFQKEVMEYLKRIDRKLNKYSTDVSSIFHGSILTPVPEGVQLEPILKMLPMKDLQDFQMLEEYLATDEANIVSFAQELSRKGGESAKEIIKKILNFTISNELGCMFSWEGHKGKHIFKNLHFANVIIKAVRLNTRTSRAQEDEIIKCIKLWLVRCKERIINAKKTTAEEMISDGSTPY